MKQIIDGISFEQLDDTLSSDDESITVFNVNDKEQSIAIIDNKLEICKNIFSRFNITSVLIMTVTHDYEIDFGSISQSDKIRRLTLNLLSTSDVKFNARGNFLPSLRELSITGKFPPSLPDLSTIKSLDTLTIKHDKKYTNSWINLQKIRDLWIIDYDATDLMMLHSLPNLRRLRLNQGRMKTLNGIEFLQKLETLFVANNKTLTNVDSLIKSTSLKSVMFSHFSKIKDWSFLRNNKNLANISLDVAETVDFIKSIKDLKFFFCKKVINRNNKSIYYSSSGEVPMMTKEGIEVTYIPSCPEFTHDLGSLAG